MSSSLYTKKSPLSIVLASTISGAANGGTAAYIRALGEHLASQGNDVRGVCRLYKDNSRVLDYGAFDTDADGNTTLSLEKWQTSLVRPSGPTTALLGQTVRLLTRPALRSLGVDLFCRAYRGAFTQAMPTKTQVVHYTGSGWELTGYAALDAARARNAVFVVTPFVHPNDWADSPVDIKLYNQADGVFVCSNYERDHLAKLGVSHERMYKIGVAPANSVRGDGAFFRQKHNLEDRPLVFFLARKQRYKGYHALREAMAAVVRVVPNVCLVVAGPDTGEEPYPSIPEYNLLDLGELRINPVDAQTKANALAACDIFCMPSDAEAFGIVYVEAWASRMPVIGGTAPAVQELIDEGVNGFRGSKDPDLIAKRLIQLLTDASLREAMAQNGWDKQQANFTWDVIRAAHEDIYRQLIAKQRDATNRVSSVS